MWVYEYRDRKIILINGLNIREIIKIIIYLYNVVIVVVGYDGIINIIRFSFLL